MFDATAAPNEELSKALKLQADILGYWLTWNKRMRDLEDLNTEEGTAVLCVPPHWPTRATLRIWSETMAEAAKRLSLEQEP
jgi:hypothetical protein